jgi:hypothetical protein
VATTKKDETPVEALAADADAPGNDEVQQATDRAEDKGYFGVETDPTPNEHYTVAGVLAGKPTPETDAGGGVGAGRLATLAGPASLLGLFVY